MIIRTIVGVVNYLHSKGIVHRDLKPENMMLEADKDFDQIKLIDFGSATRLRYGTDGKPLKIISQKIGTPYYIAPEVLNKSYT